MISISHCYIAAIALVVSVYMEAYLFKFNSNFKKSFQRNNHYNWLSTESKISIQHVDLTPRGRFHNKIICGDATDVNAYESALTSSTKADVLFTDPPYCLLERRRKNGDLRDPKAHKKKLDDDPAVLRFSSTRDFTCFTKAWLTVATQFIKQDAPIIIWTNALGKPPITTLCRELNYSFVGEYLWAKRTKLIGENEALQSTKNEVSLRVYETALVFRPSRQCSSKSTPNDAAIPWSCVTGYHEIAESKDLIQKHSHPCHKPFESIEPLIRTWTKPGDVVLDCFAGSGGIPVAAAKLGRHVAGIEVIPEWAMYASDRLKEAIRM